MTSRGVSTVSAFMGAAYHFLRLKVSVLFGANGRGLAQKKLAELMEVNPRTIQKIGAGKLNRLFHTLLEMLTRRRVRARGLQAIPRCLCRPGSPTRRSACEICGLDILLTPVLRLQAAFGCSWDSLVRRLPVSRNSGSMPVFGWFGRWQTALEAQQGVLKLQGVLSPLQPLALAQQLQVVGNLIERALHVIHFFAELGVSLRNSATSRPRNNTPRNSSKSCFHTAQDLPGVVHGAMGCSAETFGLRLLAADFLLDSPELPEAVANQVAIFRVLFVQAVGGGGFRCHGKIVALDLAKATGILPFSNPANSREQGGWEPIRLHSAGWRLEHVAFSSLTGAGLRNLRPAIIETHVYRHLHRNCDAVQERPD
jgi:hypothetical protein